MEYKSIVEELLPPRLRSEVVKCQNALRYYIRVHQTNVEKLDWAENTEAKRQIIKAERLMLEINEKQQKILKKIDKILDDYCAKLTKEKAVFDRDIIFGTANRLITRQLEKTVQNQRPPPEVLLRSAMLKKSTPYQVSLLKKDTRPVPALKTSQRPHKIAPKISSPQINNSRQNLLQALKKAKDVAKDVVEDEKETGDDTDHEILFAKDEVMPLPSRIEIKKEDEKPIVVETKGRRRRKNKQQLLVDECQSNQEVLQTSSESSKSSRRSSIDDGPKQPTTMDEMGQTRFLRMFNLFTHAEMNEYKTRRVSRRRRNCTSTTRKDFHYGNYDTEPVRLNSNKPVLYSPTRAKESKRKFLQPQASKRPKLMPELTAAAASVVAAAAAPPPPKKGAPPKVRPSTPLQQEFTCSVCTRKDLCDKMCACTQCYAFYHLSCHVMVHRFSGEREQWCPDCLKNDLSKKKRQFELNKQLNVQVLQSQHRARVMQQKREAVTTATAI